MEEFNVMLADLRQDGEVDSSGVFTLSLEKAQEKLAAYRLASPGLFVLNLVAAAVVGGAENFSIETRERTTRFAFDPKTPLESEQLEGLLSYILDPSALPYLRELALSVHGARDLPGSPRVVLATASAQMSRELVVTSSGMEVVVGSSRRPGVELRLEYPEKSGWSQLFSRKGDPREEAVRHFSHFCRFAPLTIVNNGRLEGTRVNGGVFDSSVFAWRHLTGQQRMKVVIPERRYDLTVSRKGQSPVGSSMVISLHDGFAARTSGLILLSRGVAFQRSSLELGCPMAQAVVTADHLEKNLSQSDLVEDEAYRELLRAVKAQVDDLVLEVCVSPPPGWRAETAREFSRYLARRYPTDKAAPIEVEVYLRLDGMKELCQTEAGQQQQANFWRRLSQEDPARAESFRPQLISGFRAASSQALAAKRWQAALEPLQTLEELGLRPRDSLSVALCALAGDEEGARQTLHPDLPGYSQSLEMLLTGVDSGGSGSPMMTLLRFQQAVEQGDHERADRCADELAAQNGTVLLYLWLGWYGLHRSRPERAFEMWNKAMGMVGPREWTTWNGELWKVLEGKVSFPAQVRWRVQRALEEFTLKGHRAHTNFATRQHESHQLVWARQVWRALSKKQPDLARKLFRDGYLTSLLNLEKPRLEPLDSSLMPLSFFRS